MKDDIHLTEEEQVERLKQWWKDNGSSILFGITLGIGAIVGYQYWQSAKLKTAQAASSVYQTFIETTEPTLEFAQTQSKLLKTNYSRTPYAAKGALVSAKHHVDHKDLAGAISELKWVAANAKDNFTKDLARIRLGSIYVEQKNTDELDKLVAANNKGEFEAKFKELMADSQRLKGNFEQAKALYEEALALNSDSPYKQVLKLRISQAATQAASQ